VASGAVWRAINKRTGPERIIRSSYGLLLKERFDDEFLGHLDAEDKVEWDLDGEQYVTDSLCWLIRKVSVKAIFYV
jgi:hypothetical protein